ncbi:MAG: ATP-binding protein [Bacteroidia bacterium]
MIYRIALIGPESTAKSTLSEKLAAHYHTVWVPEFARAFLNNLNRHYTKEDVIEIIKGQIRSEENLLPKANKLLFADTELILHKVWLLDKYDSSPAWLDEKISSSPYDLYLLTYPDLPFEEDPLRENPNRREFFFEWYKSELEDRKLNYRIITGTGEERLRSAIKFTEEFLTGKRI